MYFREAFDNVPHTEHLKKLRSLSITGSLWRWLREYLLDRSQCVSINGHHSDLLPVLSSVAQGSILGPMLFLIKSSVKTSI